MTTRVLASEVGATRCASSQRSQPQRGCRICGSAIPGIRCMPARQGPIGIAIVGSTVSVPVISCPSRVTKVMVTFSGLPACISERISTIGVLSLSSMSSAVSRFDQFGLSVRGRLAEIDDLQTLPFRQRFDHRLARLSKIGLDVWIKRNTPVGERFVFRALLDDGDLAAALAQRRRDLFVDLCGGIEHQPMRLAALGAPPGRT